MSCNCNNCNNIVTATNITATNGVTVITVPTGTTFVNGQCYCIGLFIDIPTGTNGNQINITNGTDTYTVYNRIANLWRPKFALRNRCLLRLKFFDDPVHFLKI